jgi:hypothetical protein
LDEGLLVGISEGLAEGFFEGVFEGVIEGLNEGFLEGVLEGAFAVGAELAWMIKTNWILAVWWFEFDWEAAVIS